MGGIGSGRRRFPFRKARTDECVILCASKLLRARIFKSNFGKSSLSCGNFATGRQLSLTWELCRSDSVPVLTLRFTVGSLGSVSRITQKVVVQATDTRVGGKRYWFSCPIVSAKKSVCGRRTMKLYLSPTSNYFGCRQCHDLAYRSAESRCCLY